MENSSIGVSFCEECQKDIPIIEKTFLLSEILGKDISGDIHALLCPQCGNVLNKNGDVKVKYYSIEDIPKVTGWKLNEFLSEQD